MLPPTYFPDFLDSHPTPPTHLVPVPAWYKTNKTDGGNSRLYLLQSGRETSEHLIVQKRKKQFFKSSSRNQEKGKYKRPNIMTGLVSKMINRKMNR